MMLLDVLRGTAPRKQVRLASIVASVLLVASFGTALPAMRGQDSNSSLVDVLAAGKHSKDTRSFPVSTHAKLKFSKNVEQVAVAEPSILEIVEKATTSKRELMMRGLKVGRTTVTVRYEDASDEQFMFSVQRDLSVLEGALKSINPSINIDIAPDRDALVLSGTVADASNKVEAEDVALRYILSGMKSSQADANEPRNSGQVINLLRVEAPTATIEAKLQREMEKMGGRNVLVRRVSEGAIPDNAKDVFVLEGDVTSLQMQRDIENLANQVLGLSSDNKKRDSRISNHLKVQNGPKEIEEVIEFSVHDIGYPNVKVHRVAQQEFRGDADILVLEGTVPSQTALSRTLALASRIFLQQELVKDKRMGVVETLRETDPSGTTRVTEKKLKLPQNGEDIHVVADESGALRQKGSAALSGARSGLQSVFSGSSSSSSNVARLLANQIDSNIARAKAVELADGRILSFITVDDIPQVRVDIKLYEINRNALLNWNSNLSATVSDFQRPSRIHPGNFTQQTNPQTGEVTYIPNPNATPTGNADFQNILSFLGGGIANQFTVSGNHVDINSLLSLLESEGIAKSLSSPSLTVLSGELAFFGVGGQIPIQTFNQTVNFTTTTTEFIDFGIQLSVRPLVDENGFITLDVVPTVSNPDADLTKLIKESTGSSQTTVSFSTRGLRTSARLSDGQALLIGGLTQHDRKDNSSQAPWIHKIPILGWLFKDFSYDDSDRELVIVVNPVVVRDAPRDAQLWVYPDTAELTGAKNGSTK